MTWEAGVSFEPFPPVYVDGGSFRFTRPFYVENSADWSALTIEVMTFYNSYNLRASVQINNVEVGKIPPLPWGTLAGELAPVSFHFFNRNVMRNWDPGTGLITGINQLSIVPVTEYDALIVGNWRLHYNQHR
jgi:hypothetical protein